MGDGMPDVLVEVAWDTPALVRPAEADYTRIDEGVVNDDDVDISPKLRRLSTSIGSRMKTAEGEPSTCDATFGDHHGSLDKHNPDGPWWPDVKKRRRIRFIATPDDSTGLHVHATAGQYASTPDHASLDITGDIDLRWFGALDDYDFATGMRFMSKDDAAPQRSWGFTVSAGTHLLQFYKSTSGSSIVGATISSTVPIPVADGEPIGLRVTRVMATGATTFYTSTDDGETWVQLGAPGAGSVGTGIHSGTAPLRVGTGSLTAPIGAIGYHRRIEVRNGIDGPIVADVDFTDASQGWAEGDTAGATGIDSTGKVWTITGAATIDTGPRPVFTGFIEKLNPEWVVGDSWCEMKCIDLLALLADDELPWSVLEVATLALGPIGYWTMTETFGTVADDLAGHYDGVYRREIRDTGQTTPFDPRPNVICKRRDEADQASQLLVAQVPSGMTQVSFADWFQWQTGEFHGEELALMSVADVAVVGVPQTKVIDIRLIPSGGQHFIEVGVYNGTSRVISRTAAKTVLDGYPHFIGATFDAATETVTVRLDDTNLAAPLDGSSPAWSTVDGSAVLAACFAFRAGWGINTIAGYLSLGPSTAAVGHAGLWDRILSSSEFDEIYAAGTAPWAGDLTGERLEKVLDLAGVDPDDRNIDPGTRTCGPAILGHQTIPDYVRKIGTTAGSPVFVDQDSRITLLPATDNDPPSTFTLTGDPAVEPGIPYTDVTPLDSVERLINDAAVTRENDATQTYSDASSIADYGRAGISIDTLHELPGGARGQAIELVVRNKEPILVITGAELASRRADVPSSLTLAGRLGDVGNVHTRPTRYGPPAVQLSVVERIQQELDFQAWDWHTTLGLTEHLVLPEPPMPTLVGTPTTYVNAAPGTGTITVAAPAGRAVGDELIALLYADSNYDATNYEVLGTFAGYGTRIARRTADGTAADDLTFSQTTNLAAWVYLVCLNGLGPNVTANIVPAINEGSLSPATLVLPGSFPTGIAIELALIASNHPNNTGSIPTPTGFTSLHSVTGVAGGFGFLDARLCARVGPFGATGDTPAAPAWTGGGAGKSNGAKVAYE